MTSCVVFIDAIDVNAMSRIALKQIYLFRILTNLVESLNPILFSWSADQYYW